MICAKTFLYDRVLVCCQTDPNPPKADKPDNKVESDKPDNEPVWYSAREMRAAYDERTEWVETVNAA